jgi:hypothetical protein
MTLSYESLFVAFVMFVGPPFLTLSQAKGRAGPFPIIS